MLPEPDCSLMLCPNAGSEPDPGCTLNTCIIPAALVLWPYAWPWLLSYSAPFMVIHLTYAAFTHESILAYFVPSAPVLRHGA